MLKLFIKLLPGLIGHRNPATAFFPYRKGTVFLAGYKKERLQLRQVHPFQEHDRWMPFVMAHEKLTVTPLYWTGVHFKIFSRVSVDFSHL